MSTKWLNSMQTNTNFEENENKKSTLYLLNVFSSEKASPRISVHVLYANKSDSYNTLARHSGVKITMRH